MGQYTWSISPANLATISSSSGVVTAGKRPGTVIINASYYGVCYSDQIDLVDECETGSSCQSQACQQAGSFQARTRSVDVRMPLGWSSVGETAGFLQIKSDYPSTNLATPLALEYNFQRSDVEKITNLAGLRQVKAPDCLADVITNNTSKYFVFFYEPKNVLAKGTDGFYVVTNKPFATNTVEFLNGETNRLRVTNFRNGTTTIADYSWIGNGWQLTEGNGLRVETKTEAFSENNTLRTVTSTLQESNQPVVFQSIEKYRTNAAYGERIEQEIFGTGANARTNSYTYTASGYLQQLIRTDGSWEYYVYDSLNRPTNVFLTFGNQPVTTDKSLCRSRELCYTNTVVAGSGDDFTQEPTKARRIVEYVKGQEVGRSYFVARTNERLNIQCVLPNAAWNTPSNLVTSVLLYTNGFYSGSPSRVLYPDGTAEIILYQTYSTNSSVATLRGHADSSLNNIDSGTRTEMFYGMGRLLTNLVTDVSSGIVLARETHKYDSFNRLTNTVYFDGTSQNLTYDCCSIDTLRDREGTLTSFDYDALKRRLTSTRNGVVTVNAYDAADNLVRQTRQGRSGGTLTNFLATFDDAGRLTSRSDGLGQVTSFDETFDASGQRILQTTYPDNSYRTEIRLRDGSLGEVSGSAVHGVRYSYDIESAEGGWREYRQQTRLDSAGNALSEWTRAYRDGVGRVYKVVQPDGATYSTQFNTSGQPARVSDPDGVTTLHQYDLRGRRSVSALHLNTAVPDIDWTADRIILSTNVVTTSGANSVVRTLTYAWATAGANAPSLIASNETRVTGLVATEVSVGGLTNQTWLVNTRRYVTNIFPGGSCQVGYYTNGLLQSETLYDANKAQVMRTTNAYDQFDRLERVTDARNGTTTNFYDAADRIWRTSTPAPAAGQPALVTTYGLDWAGRATNIVLPDGQSVTNVYYFTGELATNTGARTYPVSYTYDYAGRVQTMTTWTNYAAGLGAATTTWTYHYQRGWLESKYYGGDFGSGYAYTLAGRVSMRYSPRANYTYYDYGAGGDLTMVGYYYGTPSVAFGYDRLGRATTNIQGGGVTMLRSFDLAGNLLGETYSGGVLNGVLLTNRFDSLLRRTSLLATNTSTGLASAAFGYDAASRLRTVGWDGNTNVARYAYVSNSPLVGWIYFTNKNTLRMTTTNGYDLVNRLTLTRTLNGGSTTLSSFAYAYNPASQRTAVTNLDNSRWDYQYDALGQVSSGKHSWSDGTVVAGQQFEYDFDDLGNRTWAAEGGSEWGASLRYENYSANTLNQYTRRTVPGYVNVLGSASSNGIVTVNGESTYRKADYFRAELAVDNSAGARWLGVTNVGVLRGATTNNPDVVTTNSGNLFVSPQREDYAFDADGNQTGDGRWDAVWDAENRLVQITSRADAPAGSQRKVAWTYDGLGRRVRETAYDRSSGSDVVLTDVAFVYDGWRCVAELNATNQAVIRSYVWGLDLSGTMSGAGGVGGLLGVKSASGGTHFYSFDGNGNVAALVNATNSTTSTVYEYAPFGALLRATGPMAYDNPYRFSTKRQEFHSGLSLYEYRPYDAETGRWWTRDPLEEAGGLNLYGFVVNDPLDGIDPWGDQVYGTTGLSQNWQVRGGVRSGGGTISIQVRPTGPNGTYAVRDLRQSEQWERDLLPYERTALQAIREEQLRDRFPGHQPGMTYFTAPSAEPVPLSAPVQGRQCPPSSLSSRNSHSGFTAKTTTQLELDFVNNLGNPKFVLYKGSEFNPSMLRPGESTLNLPNLRGPGMSAAQAESLNWAQNQQALQRAMNIGNPIREANPNALGGWLQRERDFMSPQGWQRTQQGSDIFWVRPSGQ